MFRANYSNSLSGARISLNFDTSIMPIWVEFPGLPANLYQEPFIRSIAGNLGAVLQVDPRTGNLTNATASRVCIELDISKPCPSRFWIGTFGGGCWQPITYPDLLSYCSSCHWIGHLEGVCKKSFARIRSLQPLQLERGSMTQHASHQPPTLNNSGVGLTTMSPQCNPSLPKPAMMISQYSHRPFLVPLHRVKTTRG